ncbi:MAG: branched-chain amino acid ABC transporter permease [Betaproteobacteria bacterium]
MSASRWRRAMQGGFQQPLLHRPSGLQAAGSSGASAGAAEADPYAASDAPRWLKFLWRHLSARHVLIFLFLLIYPFIATPFFTFQVAAQSLILGLIALSLTFLGGYGGIVSLAQMSVAGVAGYAIAVLGQSSTPISLGWPWWVAVLFALFIASAFATLVGWLSVRTEGIYTIMITLAFGVAFYYLALQNYTLFNGFQGFQKVYPPEVFGLNWREPVPFYFMALFWAMAGYFAVKWLVRTPFGIALQGVRDNPRRMEALGFHVVAHRVAAYAFGGFLAAIGGVLLVWYNGLITPGSVNVGWQINILVIAVLGGMRHPIGAFLGAIVFVMLQTFAIDLIDRERFNLVIGLVFLAIVLFSSDGLLGLWDKFRKRMYQQPSDSVASTQRH